MSSLFPDPYYHRGLNKSASEMKSLRCGRKTGLISLFFHCTSLLYCCSFATTPLSAPHPQRDSWLMRKSPLISVRPVQSPPCGARSSVRCYIHGGTWRLAPLWLRSLCRTWSALNSGPFVSDPTGFYTASTASLELPAPGRHTNTLKEMFYYNGALFL